ncbi:MAG: RES family NAD+ phosphorylase [Bifidobacteriaceae bacterium]|jgi:hypothetical protein|nr:RES family NAD+ phosphorylase [Bifidobacteriaceae bacterium]
MSKTHNQPKPTTEKVAQTPPPTGLNLVGFPSAELVTGTSLWRAHRVTRSEWWFASAPGRFDLPEPRGTWYAADDTATAVREHLRATLIATGAVTARLAQSFHLTKVRLKQRIKCAAVSDNNAAAWGITRELVTMTDYQVTHEWAKAFAQAGFDGIRYGSRFTTGEPTAWALFGDAGAPQTPPGQMNAHMTGLGACEDAGLRVLWTPRGATELDRI